MPLSIELTEVGVAYRLPSIRPRSVKSIPVSLLPSRRVHEALWALQDVTLQVPAGQTLAVVGANGAGKSTLLRLLARAFKPSRGRVVVRGTVAPLIDLGGGLDLAATARENVVLYGALLGRPPRELRPHVEEILEWAGLLDFADVPVGTFSSGMLSRLAFAVATSGDPDILLIDEVLGVGDAAFQERSAARIHGLASRGCTVLVVSHAPDLLRTLASRAVLLERGQIRSDGTVDDVLAEYLQAPSTAITRARDSR